MIGIYFYEYRKEGFVSTIEEKFPEFLKYWDYDQNNKLGFYPDTLQSSSRQKPYWKCPHGKDHSFQAKTIDFVQKYATQCLVCSGKQFYRESMIFLLFILT